MAFEIKSEEDDKRNKYVEENDDKRDKLNVYRDCWDNE
jgi:hypothetical protein